MDEQSNEDRQMAGVLGSPAEAAEGGSGRVPSCPVCGEGMVGASLVACASCRTPHHRDCFRYNGACALFACGCRTFVEHRLAPSGMVLNLADRLSAIPHRRKRPARHGPPPPQVAAAAVPKQLVLDFLSPFELRARWLAAGSLVVLGLSMLTGPCPHRFEVTDPVMLASALGLLAGAVLALTVEDLYVFEPESRSILIDRTFLGHRQVWPAHSFDEFVGVSTTTWAFEPSASEEGDLCRQLQWLVMVRRDGGLQLVGNPVDGVGPATKDSHLRTLQRALEATGLPFQRVQVPVSLIERERRVRTLPLQFLWLATTAFLGAFAFDVTGGAPVLVTPAMAAVAFLVATGTYWWMIEWPGAFFSDPLPAKPGVVREVARAPQARPKKPGEGLTFMLLAFLALLALPFLSHAFFESLRVKLHYAQTTCRVLDSRFTESRGKSTSYQVWVRFRYRVSGVDYENSGFGLMPFPFSSETSAREAYARFPVGAEVPCWYDPAKPRSALVDTSFSWLLGALLLACLLIVQGCTATVVRLQARRGGGSTRGRGNSTGSAGG